MNAKGKLNILLADDETSTTATLSYILKRAGHQVAVVHDGSIAVSRIHDFPEHFDLVITDHMMKELSGLQLVEQLQQEKFGGDILVLSGFLTLEVKEAYQAMGVKHFLDKPFELSELWDAVNGFSLAGEANGAAL